MRRVRVVGVWVAVLSVLSVPGAQPAVAATQWHVVNFALGLPPGAAPDATTVADARAAITEVDRFYQAISHGRIRFRAGKIVTWRRSQAACTTSTVARTARRLNIRLDLRHHMVEYQPVDCGFAGLGSRPGPLVVLGRGATSSALAHELGHNLGLGHSNASRCSVAFQRACPPGEDYHLADEYGDDSDVMGGSDLRTTEKLNPTAVTPRSLGPLHQHLLGLLPRKAVRRVDPRRLTAARTVVLHRMDATSGPRVLQLPWAGRPLWLSYHAPLDPAATPHGRIVVQTPSRDTTLLLPVTRVGDLSGPLVGSTYRVSARTVLEVLEAGAQTAVLRLRRVGAATPTRVSVTAGVRSATVSWAAPVVAGLTGYEVRLVSAPISPGGEPRTVSTQVAAGERTATLTGLAADVPWRAHVVPLVNGAAAPAAVATPFLAKPDPAHIPTFPAVVVGDGTVRVTWQQPSDPAAAIVELEVTVEVRNSRGFSWRRAYDDGISGGEMVVAFSGHGRLTVTAEATYPSGETYTEVLRRGLKV